MCDYRSVCVCAHVCFCLALSWQTDVTPNFPTRLPFFLNFANKRGPECNLTSKRTNVHTLEELSKPEGANLGFFFLNIFGGFAQHSSVTTCHSTTLPPQRKCSNFASCSLTRLLPSPEMPAARTHHPLVPAVISVYIVCVLCACVRKRDIA